jgi:hypothetical protein
MGASYRPDNPYAPTEEPKDERRYSPDNPFAPKPVPQKHDYHAEYRSGALQKRMEAANAADVVAAQPSDDEMKAAHALNLAQGVPGMEAFQAAAGAVGSGRSYRESLDALRSGTEHIGGGTRAAEQFIGALPLAALPGSPAVAGATYGAASGAFNADPDIENRAQRTIVGGLLGGAIGKAGELVGTGIRAARAASVPANVLKREGARSAASSPLYDAAEREGQGTTNTKAIQRELHTPDTRAIITQLRTGTREFAGMPANDPRMIDAVYKVLSDRNAKAGVQLANDPTNVGRFAQQTIEDQKKALLNVIDPVMPSYRKAVQTFAKHSGEIDAVTRGRDVLAEAIRPGIKTGAQAVDNSPEAFLAWAKQASPAERQAAAEGILGAVKEEPKTARLNLGVARVPLPILPGKGIRRAATLLRAMGLPEQVIVDRMAKAGLLGAAEIVAGSQ